MNAELINTGTELLLGRVLNTHQQWLCTRLSDLGLAVVRQTAVADSSAAIRDAVCEALGRSDWIIVTGGLGPTADDLTRDLIAGLAGKKLIRNETVFADLARFYAERGRPVPERADVQALVPEGADVLPNVCGTAPGLVIRVDAMPFRVVRGTAWLVLLPGPPRELHPMFENHVAPLIRRHVPVRGQMRRILKTTGLPESLVEQRLIGPLGPLVESGLDLGYCARPGEVEIRLAAEGPEAASKTEEAVRIVRHALGSAVFGEDRDTLESVVVRGLAAGGQMLALAESCTGGLIAHRVTNVPGASKVFLCGGVVYSNEAKQRWLGVCEETLRRHGAVSGETALEMAEGIRVRNGADFGLAVTGIAGPDGGSAAKPVGTVFMALAGKTGTVVEHHFNPFDRETFKTVASQQALDLLRRTLPSGAD